MSEPSEPIETPESTEPPESAEDVLAGELRPPSQDELNSIPADRRLELLELQAQRQERTRDRREQRRHQWINSVVLLIGTMLAGGSLLATALTLRTGQDQLHATREGQVTDRYTKAVEQLGSSKREVRTAALYALERIATDSLRDRLAIRDVLAHYIREHDLVLTAKANEVPAEPDMDVQAALTVIGRRPADPATSRTASLDLHGICVPRAYFPPDSNLAAADLTEANLTGAALPKANLAGAGLTFAVLTRASLRGADLRGADLRMARLPRADLRDADLRGADLRGANLGMADLHRADLRGTDLRGVTEESEAEIRRVARVDANTRFGPHEDFIMLGDIEIACWGTSSPPK